MTGLYITPGVSISNEVTQLYILFKTHTLSLKDFKSSTGVVWILNGMAQKLLIQDKSIHFWKES